MRTQGGDYRLREMAASEHIFKLICFTGNQIKKNNNTNSDIQKNIPIFGSHIEPGQ